MKMRIEIPAHFSEMRYGILFERGIGYTSNKNLAETMKQKGFTVTPAEPDEYDSEEDAKLAFLMEQAEELNVDLGRTSTVDGMIGKFEAANVEVPAFPDFDNIRE